MNEWMKALRMNERMNKSEKMQRFSAYINFPLKGLLVGSNERVRINK